MSTAPKDLLFELNPILVAKFHLRHDEEDETCEGWFVCMWVHVAHPMTQGWSLCLRGLSGVSGGHVLMELEEATHWQRLDIEEFA